MKYENHLPPSLSYQQLEDWPHGYKNREGNDENETLQFLIEL